MSRLRLGVAAMLPADISAEIDGLRRALGDGALGRIDPHITLVPPVNVREDELPAALEVFRRAAANTEPLSITLGPVSTFHPDTPVIKLDVGGPGLDELLALRNQIFVPPFERPLTWPYVPHVTLADEATLTRIRQAVPALDQFRVDVQIDSVFVLEEAGGRQWSPVADAVLGGSVELGRGSLPMQLYQSSLVDPLTLAALDLHPLPTSLVLTAFRERELLGVTAGVRSGHSVVLEHCKVAGDHRGQGVGSTLMREYLQLCRDLGVYELTLGPYMPDPCPFTAQHGFENGRLRL